MNDFLRQQLKSFDGSFNSIQHPAYFWRDFDAIYETLLNDYDRRLFLSSVSAKVQDLKSKHEQPGKCAMTPQTCGFSIGATSILYRLSHMLENLGIIGEEQFTPEKFNIIVDQLDRMVEAHKEAGLEIEKLRQEVEDLKAHAFMGKRGWFKYAIGSFSGWIGSGIASEVISKPIAESILGGLPKLGL